MTAMSSSVAHHQPSRSLYSTGPACPFCRFPLRRIRRTVWDRSWRARVRHAVASSAVRWPRLRGMAINANAGKRWSRLVQRTDRFRDDRRQQSGRRCGASMLIL